MVKLVFLCRRRPDISHARYAELLLRDHVPIALRHHPTLRRYVVNIVEESPPDAPLLDSIGELWFDTLEDFRQRLYDSPEGERIVVADVARFMGGADAYVVEETVHRVSSPHTPVGTRTPGSKLIVCARRAPACDADAFAAAWTTRRVPDILARWPAITAYTTARVRQVLGNVHLPWDTFEAVYGAPGVAPDALRNAVDRGRPATAERLTAYRVGEHVQRR